MRRRFRTLWFVVLAAATVLGVAVPAASADDAGAAGRVASVDVSQYPDVSMSIRAAGDLANTDLPPTAFSVSEGGHHRDATVTRLAADDLQVVLAVDTSGSMAGAAMTAAKQAALTFLNRMAPSTLVGVVGFGSHPAVVAPLSTDRVGVTRAVGALQAVGETSLYDAVSTALAQFPPPTPTTRRSVVVLSDGGDTVSTHSLDAVSAEVVAAHARLDVVELVTSESNPGALQRLAAAGGGIVTPADSPGALVAAYDAVAASLVAEYRVAWRSEAHGPTPIHLEIAVGPTPAAFDTTATFPAAVVPPPATPSPVPQVAPRPAPRAPFDLSVLAFVGGGWLIFLALLLAFALAFLPTRSAAARLGGPKRPSKQRPSSVSEVVERASTAAEGVLTRQGRLAAINSLLERAGIALRPGEFIVLVVCAEITGALVGMVVGGILFALLLAVLVAVGFKLVLGLKAGGRQRKFHDQLPDTLQLLSSTLRAGYGILQGVDAVAREADVPTSDEFRRVVVETRLGRDLSDALHAAAARVGGEDFEWVVLAIDVHREVGGDLAEVIDTVAKTIRERNQLRRQVKSLTAEGRVSAYILVALPFCVATMLAFVNPTYVSMLLHGFGLVLVGVCVVLMTLGSLWLKKLCKLVF